jgi:chemotaxis protein MotA
MGLSMNSILSEEANFFVSIKSGIIAHMQGYAPQVSIEFARKTIPAHLRPTFAELEEAIENAGKIE